MFNLYAEASEAVATEVVVPEGAWRIYVIIRSYVTMFAACTAWSESLLLYSLKVPVEKNGDTLIDGKYYILHD